MSQFEYDLFVIGAGSGGVRTARMAAAQGLRVAVAEKSKAGGTCVNLGCIPKNSMSMRLNMHRPVRTLQGSAGRWKSRGLIGRHCAITSQI